MMVADARAMFAARRWKVGFLLFALIGLGANGGTFRSLDKIADSLRSSSRQLETANRKTAEELSAALHSEESLASRALLSQLQQVQTRAGLAAGFIDSQIDELKSDEVAGRNATHGGLARPDETATNYRYWSTPRGSGKSAGLILKDSLDSFVAWANGMRQEIESATGESLKLSFDGFQSITNDAGNEDAACETWVQQTFQGASAAADLILLEKWKYDVRSIENQLLASIGRAAKTSERQLMAVVAPKSQSVLVGQDFEAVVYLALAPDTKGNAPKPVFSGEGVQATAGGTTATIKIPAKAESLRKKDNIQSYSGAVKVPKENGEFEELPFQGEFQVFKPSIDICRSACGGLPIYQDCANEITLDAPAFFDAFEPAHTASGGEIHINKISRNRMMLIPASSRYSINIIFDINGTNVEIESRTFKALPPPLPAISVTANHQQWSRGMGVRRDAKIRFSVKPDKDFAAAVPMDARYVIEGFKVSVIDKGVERAPSLVVEKSELSPAGEAVINVDLSMLEDLKPGDQVKIEFDKLHRLNFKDQRFEETEFSSYDKRMLFSVE